MVNQPCVETEVWSPQGGGRKEQGKSVWGRDGIKKSIKSNKETEKKRPREQQIWKETSQEGRAGEKRERERNKERLIETA